MGPGLLLVSHVTPGQPLSFPRPQFPHLQMEIMLGPLYRTVISSSGRETLQKDSKMFTKVQDEFFLGHCIAITPSPLPSCQN